MNFREYFRTRLPGLYFEPGTWLEKIKEIMLMPADIFLQVFDYIPRLRDLINGDAPADGLELEAKQRNSKKYNNEPTLMGRLQDSWNIWGESGSRYGLNRLITMCGYTMDTTTYEYGIQEHAENQKYAYWGSLTNPSVNRGVCYNHFYWGGYIDSKFSYIIYIVDPEGDIYNTDAKVNDLIHMCYTTAPAHCNLAAIKFTDGAGNVLNTTDLLE